VKALVVKNTCSKKLENESSSFHGENKYSLCGFGKPQLCGFVSTRGRVYMDMLRRAYGAFNPKAGKNAGKIG